MLANSTNTSYEQYTGGIPSPNPSYPQEVKTVKGYRNLFDTNNVTDSNTQHTFVNDILTVQSTGGTYNRINYNSTEVGNIIKANPNKTLKFSYENIDLSEFTSSNNVIVLLAWTESGTRKYFEILKKSGQNVVSTDVLIPSDTSTLTNIVLVVYTNNNNASNTDSKVVITKPMFYFVEDAINPPYVPYGNNYIYTTISDGINTNTPSGFFKITCFSKELGKTNSTR
mgnify:CR=1 FL=1